MAIPKGATVILADDPKGRQGTVLREVDPQVLHGVNEGGEVERNARYEVHWPDAGEGAPEWTQVHFEYELKVIPRDKRFSG